MNYTFKPYKKSPLLRNHLRLGGKNPDGGSIDVTSLYIEKNGTPVIPVMGEYHFVRDSRSNWYKELCKMKAGGITVAATYLFMIYHCEDEGVYDFSGDLDIRQFVLDAQKAGLDVILRLGPWAHGECRNGGFPDWLLKKPFKLRQSNPDYMAVVREWYTKIYNEVKGLFYKDGGNIIGIQLENELVDDAEHLLDLKKLALEIGFDVPLYTVTGWNSAYGAKIPVDDVLPVFGAYPEAPWTGHINPLPASPHYVFNKMRNDSAIGSDQIAGGDKDGWLLPYERYPFATCELGGGIEVTHHRRPLIMPMDIYAISLVKLGSGNNLIGYYMYHGGSNKIGKYSILNESKATGYPNDYPIISYDFQAPISQYGEIRWQFNMLNMLHLFTADFGDILAPMESVESTETVSPEDMHSLRYAMRTDGNSGFVFINNYQRLRTMEPKKHVVIDTGTVVFPEISVKSDISFIMPFNINLGDVLLEYATAQLLCRDDNTYFFAAIPGIKPIFKTSAGEHWIDGEIKHPQIIKCGDIQIVVLPYVTALKARRLDGKLYFGNIYSVGGEIYSIRPEDDIKYLRWNSSGFDEYEIKENPENAEVHFEDCDEIKVKYRDELMLSGERKLTFKKVNVTSGVGFIEVPYKYDTAQLYINGTLAADDYYYGRSWRLPAAMIYGNEAVLVYSELKDDCYLEYR